MALMSQNWAVTLQMKILRKRIRKKETKKRQKKKKPKSKNNQNSNLEEKEENALKTTATNEDGTRCSTFTAAQHAAFIEALLAVKNGIANLPPVMRDMKEDVEREQSEFLELLRHSWNTAYEKHNVLVDGAHKYTDDKWKLQLKRVKNYPQFYRFEKSIPLVHSKDGSEIQMMPLQVLLEMGVVPKLHIPRASTDITAKICTDYTTMLLMNTSSNEDSNTLHQITVSCDKNAEHLALKHRAHVVISSSSLKCIADNISPKFDKVWNIPALIKQYSIKDSGSDILHKIVYIDKKLPPKAINVRERNAWFHKLAVKSFLCHPKDPEAFRYPEKEDIDIDIEFTSEQMVTLIDNDQSNQNTDFCDACKLTKKQVEKPRREGEVEADVSDSDSNCSLVIDENADNDLNKTNSNVCVCEESAKVNDQEGSRPSICHQKDINNTIIPPPSKTNITYRLWKFYYEERSKEDLHEEFLKGQNSHQELRVLVRCKMDACEHENMNLSPICLSSKMEYQAEHGVEKISLSSLVKEWVSLFFRPEASLTRVRINAATEEIIMTEKSTLREIAQMASSQYGLQIRRTVLGSLYQIMSTLLALIPGSYILSHDVRSGPFATVLQQTNENFTYDLHADYESINTSILSRESAPQWISIDTSTITPSQIARKRIPATFEPCN